MKKIIALLALLPSVFALAWRESVTTNDSYAGSGCRYMVDSETGVNYILDNGSYGNAIYPRYNADGTLYVSDER